MRVRPHVALPRLTPAAGHRLVTNGGTISDPSFSQRVYRAVQRIPPGRVIAYGGIAALLGAPRAARGVGHALATLPEGTSVPWWRVVNGKGEISLTHHRGLLQRSLLEAEGVRFERGGRIDWKKYGWKA